jgi:anti-sigma B factor antagonist
MRLATTDSERPERCRVEAQCECLNPARGGHARSMEFGRDDKLSSPQLVITLQHRTDAVVLTLVGEIDIATSAELRAAVGQIITNNAVTAMHIDADRVTFVDSAGVRSLMQARQAAVAHGLLFTLCAERGGQVEHVITLSGLHARSPITPPRTPDHPPARMGERQDGAVKVVFNPGEELP